MARMIQTNIAPPMAATIICPIMVVGKRPTIEANQPPIMPPISPITKSPIKPKPRPLADYLKPQYRFAELSEKQMETAQAAVGVDYKKLTDKTQPA